MESAQASGSYREPLDVACSLCGLDYLVRLSHEWQYVVGQLYARCVYEATARGLDRYGSEGHRILACDTECFRHQDSDVDRAGIGVRPEDDRQKGCKYPPGNISSGAGDSSNLRADHHRCTTPPLPRSDDCRRRGGHEPLVAGFPGLDCPATCPPGGLGVASVVGRRARLSACRRDQDSSLLLWTSVAPSAQPTEVAYGSSVLPAGLVLRLRRRSRPASRRHNATR